MNHSEMGDLQDALANLIPQSAIPTFDELESWSSETIADVRAWVDGNGNGPTPVVFHEAIARYHAPRAGYATHVGTRFDRMDADEEHSIATLGRDVGFSPWSYR